MEFVKMHGIGNDFIMIAVETWSEFENYQPWAKPLCDRHFGIGADGLIGIGPDQNTDIFMRIYNADGSEAEMCGNGIRCAAHFAKQRGLTNRNECSVRTLAGNIYPEIIESAETVAIVKVNMGVPIIERSRIPMLGEGAVIGFPIEALGQLFTATAVSMGNPHCIIFVEQLEAFPAEKYGPVLEIHPLFPAKTNVEFIKVIDPQQLLMSVWERGSGITQACGTGACAALVAAVMNGYADRRANVRLAGGDLLIEWNPENNQVFMTGKAQEVFSGNINLASMTIQR